MREGIELRKKRSVREDEDVLKCYTTLKTEFCESLRLDVNSGSEKQPLPDPPTPTHPRHPAWSVLLLSITAAFLVAWSMLVVDYGFSYEFRVIPILLTICLVIGFVSWCLWESWRVERQRLRGVRLELADYYYRIEDTVLDRIHRGGSFHPIDWRHWSVPYFLRAYTAGAGSDFLPHTVRRWRYWAQVAYQMAQHGFVYGASVLCAILAIFLVKGTTVTLHTILAGAWGAFAAFGILSPEGGFFLLWTGAYAVVALVALALWVWRLGWIQTAYSWLRQQASYWWDFASEFCRVAGWYLAGELAQLYARANPTLYFAEVRKKDVGIND